MSRDIQSSLGPAVTGTVPAVVVSWRLGNWLVS